MVLFLHRTKQHILQIFLVKLNVEDKNENEFCFYHGIIRIMYCLLIHCIRLLIVTRKISVYLKKN